MATGQTTTGFIEQSNRSARRSRARATKAEAKAKEKAAETKENITRGSVVYDTFFCE